MSVEVNAVIFSLLVLAVACTVLAGLKRFVGTIDGTAFVALLLVPLIVYALLSGRLREFKGPGGWGGTFQSVAQSAVQPTGIIEDTTPLQTIDKRGLRDLKGLLKDLDPSRPNALRLRVGRENYYNADVIKSYLKTLMTVGPSTYAVFVDNASGRFVGSANASQIIAILDTPRTAQEFVDELERGGADVFGGYDFLVRESLTPEDTNSTALEKFLSTNAEALVVVSSEDGMPDGIIDRNRLITKLMLKLTDGNS